MATGFEIVNKFRGWRTNDKIIVFESDDWGSIRTSSLNAIRNLENNGVRIRDCHYMMYDRIESNEDMEALFEVLLKHKNINGNHPIFTLNIIVGNPSFEKIESSKYFEYHYETFIETYKKYNQYNLITTWKEGIKSGLIYPQFHGREHVNFNRWLYDLQNHCKETIIGFQNEMFGISRHTVNLQRGSYLAVFDEIGYNKRLIEQIISDGLAIFNTVFDFKPKTFIAPNYIWNAEVERVAMNNGIISMQGISTQIFPTKGDRKQGLAKHYIKKKSDVRIGYLVRNVFFEPSSDMKKNWINSALKQIEYSFAMNKPATICTHRVNYMGTLSLQNRKNGLEMLDELLRRILIKWPEVQFLDSESLAIKINELS